MKDYMVQQLEKTDIIGYKFTEANYQCRGLEYENGLGLVFEIGKTYSLYCKLKFGENGFTFCEDFDQCYKYYDNIDGDCHLLKVKAVGTVLTDGTKCCTDKIEILEEITDIYGLIDENQDTVNWDMISSSQRLSADFIERHSEKVDWERISRYQKLSEDFIDRNSEKVNWEEMVQSRALSEELMERHSEKVAWDLLAIYQDLSEDFIDRHSDKINWEDLIRCQYLSEDLIERNIDKVDWTIISYNQILSKAFIKRHKDKIIFY